jgi:hypothetical protein
MRDAEWQRTAGRGQYARPYARGAESKADVARGGEGVEQQVALLPAFPVVRIPPQVHHGKDENAIGVHAIEDSVGEPVHQAASDLTGKHRPGLWETEDSVDRGVNLENSSPRPRSHVS